MAFVGNNFKVSGDVKHRFAQGLFSGRRRPSPDLIIAFLDAGQDFEESAS
jgi:hypothetical protein